MTIGWYTMPLDIVFAMTLEISGRCRVQGGHPTRDLLAVWGAGPCHGGAFPIGIHRFFFLGGLCFLGPQNNHVFNDPMFSIAMFFLFFLSAKHVFDVGNACKDALCF